MKLLKIGNKYINLEQVTDVEVGPNYVEIFFGLAPETPLNVVRAIGSHPGIRTLRFEGEEAQALHNWLDQNAEVIRS